MLRHEPEVQECTQLRSPQSASCCVPSSTLLESGQQLTFAELCVSPKRLLKGLFWCARVPVIFVSRRGLSGCDGRIRYIQ